VVFTTSMTGYPEVLTDPSYAGQIVVMAFPMVGTYGVESRVGGKPQALPPRVRGAAREPVHLPLGWPHDPLRIPSQLGVWWPWRAWTPVSSCGTCGWRALKRGVLATGPQDPEELVRRAQAVPDLSCVEVVEEVSPPAPFTLPGTGPRVAVVDCGLKMGIARELHARGCEVVVLPHRATAAEILALDPDGVVLSNGPGDPARLAALAQQVRALWGRVPLFGVCLGNQLVALSAGARTFKLPFGHRGSNHPVLEVDSGRVRITTQNHGYAVDEASLAGTGLRVTHRNLHDGTVEGLAHEQLPVFAVQFHPEARPGPRDSRDLFDRFLGQLHSARAAGIA
jgi:carbamoyl-phosphate synthase small subunit